MPEQTNAAISPENNQEQGKPMGARDFVLRYLKYLPLIIICGALALIIAYIRLRYSVPIYKVQSSLLIRNERSNSGASDAKLDELFLSESNINLSNEIEILKSHPLIQRVAYDLGLQTSYYNRGNLRSTMFYEDLPFRLQILQLGDSLKGFGLTITVLNDEKFALNNGKTYYFGQPFHLGATTCVLARDSQVNVAYLQSKIFDIGFQPLTSAADNIINNLKVVQPNEQATILNLSLEIQNIPMGQDVLKTIMAVYDSMIIEDKNKIAKNTLRFIEERIDTLNDQLVGVEGRLRNVREQNQGVDLESQSRIFIDKITETSKSASTQAVQMTIINWLLEYVTSTKHVNDLVPTDLGVQEPLLLQLITQYNTLQLQRASNLKTTPVTNPMIQGFDTSLEKIRQNIIEALRNVKTSYEIAGNKLAQEQQEVQSQSKTIPGKMQQTLTITRQQKILEDLYSFLLQEKLKTAISSASTVSNSKILEPAVGSNIPVKPNRGSLFITYLLIGLVIPISIISVIEVLSDKVNNRGEIERATSAPILGEIGHSQDSATLVVTKNSRRFIAEQFRIIRTNLQYITARNERPVILVTSSFSGEGKSFVSTNVGAVMALAGKKTVILEFDIRKPKILSSLDLKRKLGITNYLIGKSNFEDLPLPVEGIENLYVIACGPIPPNPSELLLSPRLKELIREVKENFEVVIMDTAPVGLVSDAITLGVYADCTLYIVRRGHTVRRLMSLIQDLYMHKKLPSLAILLNDVKLEGSYYGGYYGGYGYYGYGYGHEGGYFDKEDTPEKTRHNPPFYYQASPLVFIALNSRDRHKLCVS